ncbi:hypothetical protein ACFE04_030767 [Oxalis oulophora]
MGFYVCNVKFHNHKIFTTVTSSESAVDEWIAQTLRITRNELCDVLVGLDTEFKLSHCDGRQPVAIAQLCIGHRCLIYQLCHASKISASFITFLEDDKFTFVGKAVKNDAYKLMEDYGLKVGKIEDVSKMASKRYNNHYYESYGLSRLADQFLGTPMEKSKRITLSRWDKYRLSKEQIKYAAIDAFVSLRLAEEFTKPQ